MESPSPIEIISIDVPDTVLRKNIQNATSLACAGTRHVGVGVGGGLDEAREKFISALVAENGNAKHITGAKAAYPGLAKQIIATETGESQILDEVGFVDDDRRARKKVVRVQPRSTGQVDEVSSAVAAAASRREAFPKTFSLEAKEIGAMKLAETSDKTRVERDIVEIETGKASRDDVDKSRISSTAVSTSVTDSGGGRHEGALSDFSVDKADYRLTRYGMDDSIEEEIPDPGNDSRLGRQRSIESAEYRRESVAFKDEEAGARGERQGSDDQDSFSNESVRCPNTQVLVLVSAMIHNPFEKEAATLIVEDNGVQGKGEITIYKGESDGSIDKLSLLVQSPVPSSVSDESTVKIQEITDEVTEILKDGSDDSLGLDRSSRRDASLEIDGKYVKSVVNSRKSPRKAKNGQAMRVHGNEDVVREEETERRTEKRSADSGTQSEDTFYKTISRSSDASSSRGKSPRREGRSRSGGRKDGAGKIRDSSVGDERTKKAKRYDAALKGSLDSVISPNDSRSVSGGRRSRNEETLTSKKSKSCESIKRIQEGCYEDPSKADSTSQLITARELDMQTDEFCSVCCYANELSLRTEEGIVSPSQDNFYAAPSNCSSIVDEDSTECDICSSWNLQESATDAFDRKLISSANTECDQLCEVCEICSEICATYNADPATGSFATPVDARDPTRSLPLDNHSRIGDSAATDAPLDEDSFEIENCGFQSGPESTGERNPSQLGNRENELAPEPFDVSDSVVARTMNLSRDKYFIPKDELAILSSGSRRMNRKGSLIRKKATEDPANVSQDKRRYSSVDNLQSAKVSSRSNENKILRPRSSKLIGSADNIRASRSSRRCKSLQRSADNVRYVGSSTDNLDSLVESIGREDDGPDPVNRMDKPKIRDNETVKMILTKHGIKIISEKETAL